MSLFFYCQRQCYYFSICQYSPYSSIDDGGGGVQAASNDVSFSVPSNNTSHPQPLSSSVAVPANSSSISSSSSSNGDVSSASSLSYSNPHPHHPQHQHHHLYQRPTAPPAALNTFNYQIQKRPPSTTTTTAVTGYDEPITKIAGECYKCYDCGLCNALILNCNLHST